MRSAARKLTYEDYVQIPEDGYRHEIIAGEELMTPAPEVPHQRASRILGRILDDHIGRHALGEVFHAPIDVVLSEVDIVQPDLIFVSAERAAIITRKNIQGAPDLVVELTFPSTAATDRGRKAVLYAEKGVREYWIVDLAARLVEVHELRDSRRVRVHAEHQHFESAILPGLSIRVAEILAEPSSAGA